jgi:hypothetical protein
MKIIIPILFILGFGSCVEQTKYCGPVIEKYRLSGGYKTSPECHVIFYSPELKRNIDVEVTFNTYANIKDSVCFLLTEPQLKN